MLQGVFRKLHPELQKAVTTAGYTQPTPIQTQCIPYLLQGRDILGCAPTGTGKTASFVLPILHKLIADKRRPVSGTPRVLILAPTRELAAQIGESIRDYGRYSRLRHTVVFGGVNQNPQVKALQRGVDLLVATPGRLLDLMQQRHIHLERIEFFVLDEVDRMLDMGFLPAIRQVLNKVPAQRQTLFFSATMAPSIIQLADTMVHNPARVTVKSAENRVDQITQKVLFVGKDNKDSLLVSLLNDHRIHKAIIFTQMKHVANKVVKRLSGAGIEGAAIHGNKSQAARTKALNGFKRGQFRVLVATDVAARGIDVDDITHVINYDLPVEAETYVHRIGRTARAGAQGDAISFCSAEDRAYLKDIEKLIGSQVPVDLGHDYHCDLARNSTAGKPVMGSQRNRRPQGSSSRNRYRR